MAGLDRRGAAAELERGCRELFYLAPDGMLTAVPVSGHDHHPPTAFGPQAHSAASLAKALAALTVDPARETVLIAGSLYLVGDALAQNGNLPA